MGVDHKQPVPGVETRGAVSWSYRPRRGRSGVHQAPVPWRDLESDGPACRLLATSSPVRKERSRGFSVGAVENKEVPVPRSLHEHLLLLAVKISVDQNWSFDGIPIVRIVRRSLERPHQLARLRIQRDDGARVKIIAWPRRAGSGQESGCRFPSRRD